MHCPNTIYIPRIDFHPPSLPDSQKFEPWSAKRKTAPYLTRSWNVGQEFDLTDSYGNTANEGRVIALEFDAFYVVSVYTPNAKDDLSRLPVRERWDEAFLVYMKQLQDEKPVIFSGDLNVAHTELDLARPKENKGKKGFTEEERGGIDKMLSAGFVDTYRSLHKEGGAYTWWSHFAQARERNVGWRIDYVMASKELIPLIKKASIHADVYGSDHCPVSVEISI